MLIKAKTIRLRDVQQEINLEELAGVRFEMTNICAAGENEVISIREYRSRRISAHRYYGGMIFSDRYYSPFYYNAAFILRRGSSSTTYRLIQVYPKESSKCFSFWDDGFLTESGEIIFSGGRTFSWILSWSSLSDYQEKLQKIYQERTTDGRPYKQISFSWSDAGMPKVTEELVSLVDDNEISSVEDDSNKGSKSSEKKVTKMKNDVFTVRQLKSDKIAGSLLGIAVKVDDQWKAYNDGRITDFGKMEPPSLPVFVMPAFELNEGDFVLDKDEVHVVLTTGREMLRVIQISTGDIRTIIPTRTLLGFSVYQRLVCVTDALGISIDNLDSSEDMLLMMAMSSGGEGMGELNQNLLPLMMLRGGRKKGVDRNNMLLAMAMLGNGEGAQDTGMIPILMMRELFGTEKKSRKKSKKRTKKKSRRSQQQSHIEDEIVSRQTPRYVESNKIETTMPEQDDDFDDLNK